jgi:predicted N-acetyltransferase YhbS
MPGPVDAARVLVFELIDGAFEGVSGQVAPDWSRARG